MPNFLTQIQAVETSTAQAERPQLEPRSVRRRKARIAKQTKKNPAAPV